MELELAKNPILTKPCEEFDFTDPPVDPVVFAKALVKLMRDSQGLGLAANQCGYMYRVFAMRADPNKVFYNPKIVNLSEELIALEEGCLSFPGLYVTIKRPRHARIRYTQPNGETLTEQFTGMSARIIQHEMDHLDGIIFYNRANRYHRELALDRWRKGNKQIKGGADLKDVTMHEYEIWSHEQGKEKPKLITSEIDLTEEKKMTETTDAEANTEPVPSTEGAEPLDPASQDALEEWQRIRESVFSLTLSDEGQEALDEWIRIRKGSAQGSIFNPAKDYPVGKFNYLESIRFRWLVPRIFDFVPRSSTPYSFTRYNGQVIMPRRMFTDGGSIPRLARWIGQLDPWEYTPAYCLHDWLFEMHHCNVAHGNPDIYTFDDATEILMEAIHTMDHEKIAPVSDAVFHLIKYAVSSFVARHLWDADVKKCTLPPDMED